MSCIQSYSLLIPIVSQLRQTHRLQQRAAQLCWLCSPATESSSRRNLGRPNPRRTKVVTSSSSLVVAATYGGDVSVLLQTGGVLLFVYWIANFVVPAMILKDLQSDGSNEETESTDNENPADDVQ